MNTSFALKNVGLGVTFVNELIDGRKIVINKKSLCIKLYVQDKKWNSCGDLNNVNY